jgi:hypothetical protein
MVEMILSRVVLPEPLAPIIATNSPSFTLKEILLIAFVSEDLLP